MNCFPEHVFYDVETGEISLWNMYNAAEAGTPVNGDDAEDTPLYGLSLMQKGYSNSVTMALDNTPVFSPRILIHFADKRRGAMEIQVTETGIRLQRYDEHGTNSGNEHEPIDIDFTVHAEKAE